MSHNRDATTHLSFSCMSCAQDIGQHYALPAVYEYVYGVDTQSLLDGVIIPSCMTYDSTAASTLIELTV